MSTEKNPESGFIPFDQKSFADMIGKTRRDSEELREAKRTADLLPRPVGTCQGYSCAEEIILTPYEKTPVGELRIGAPKITPAIGYTCACKGCGLLYDPEHYLAKLRAASTGGT